jgi:hypothetical protein
MTHYYVQPDADGGMGAMLLLGSNTAAFFVEGDLQNYRREGAL